MALRQVDNYWYGDSPADVWDYFVWWTRNSVEPVKHWRQAICKCGNANFRIDLFKEEPDGEPEMANRICPRCRDVHEIISEGDYDDSGLEEIDTAECLCGNRTFEVVGVTAPFQGDTKSAKWFYLGLRCIACGCLGCYAGPWCPRYKDYRQLLALV